MALTDNPKEKTRKRNKSRAVDAGSNFRWSDKQKMEAVTTYLALGNMRDVHRITGIPEITLRVWKASVWWKELVEELKVSDKIVLSNKLKRLVELSQTIVEQRLTNGDPVVTNKGEVIYRPVSMKDAHRVAVDLMDRKAVLDKTTTDDAPSEEKNDNKLEQLAERFAEMATKSIEKQFDKKRTVEATDVIFVDKDVPEGNDKERSDVGTPPFDLRNAEENEEAGHIDNDSEGTEQHSEASQGT